MAGIPATKIPAIPPEPVAAAWMMEFSWGPKEPPRMGQLWQLLDKILTIPYPKMEPKILAGKVNPVLRPDNGS